MKRKVAMAMVAAMAVGSLAVPVMAEDGAAGGKIGISMPTQSLERWNRDGSYLQKQFEDAGYEVELTYSDNETDRQVNDIQNLISDGVNHSRYPSGTVRSRYSGSGQCRRQDIQYRVYSW